MYIIQQYVTETKNLIQLSIHWGYLQLHFYLITLVI